MVSDDGEFALVKRAAAGDERAFETLVERHASAILRVARSRLRDAAAAEEIAQDAFVRLFRALRSFRGESSLRTWLVRVTLNLCNDAHRRRQRLESQLPLDAVANMVTDVDGDRPPVSARAEQLQVAIASLPDAQRTVLLLRYDADLSYSQISSVLKIPLGTVGTRLTAALKALRTQITSSTATP